MGLPIEFRWLTANGFDGYVPWYFIKELGQEGLRREYQKETNDDFYPFARRQDNDDVAGFKVVNGKLTSEVVTVHLTWSGKNEMDSFPSQSISKNIFQWLKEIVIPDTEDWMSEEDLEDLLTENA